MNATDINNLPVDLPKDLLPIKPEMSIPDPYWWMPWLIGITVTLIILVPLCIWALRRMRMPAAKIPPHERARKRLAEAQSLMGESEPFCVLVSHTLRTYLEERYSLHAPEETTEEFLVEMQSSPNLTKTQKEMVGEFLEHCDLVKFARHELGDEKLERLLQAASQIVNETAVQTAAPVSTIAQPVKPNK